MVSSPPPRNAPRNEKNCAHMGAHTQNQPKPKNFAQKNPTGPKKGKAKVPSNRSGGAHMA